MFCIVGPNDSADQKVENSCNNDGYKEILSLKEMSLNQKKKNNLQFQILLSCGIFNFHQERLNSYQLINFLIINEIYTQNKYLRLPFHTNRTDQYHDDQRDYSDDSNVVHSIVDDF